MIKKDKSFFCSELVATAFKRLKILDSERAASKYWPGDFSSKCTLRGMLINGASFGEE